ncbi:endonuclease MutS2 [Ornithobacterium rhinotracheale]|uniref:endonuclease MutS2 n=1 Tax=Ornithobacterium rhinotracheale TaxID=28251 RepID=UPI003FA44521
MKIPQKTLEDLEFNKVLLEVEKYAKTERVKRVIRKHKPLASHKTILFRLKATNEYLSAMQSSNRFPFSEYDDIREDLDKIEVENYQLSADIFLAIKSQMLQIQELMKFLEKFKDYYPIFYKTISKLTFQKEVLAHIDTVFDKHGEIKDDASKELLQIRKQLKIVNQQLSDRFKGASRAYSEYLDDIRESVIDGRRVLAVLSTHRKKVPGRMVGSSKTGSIAFIEPESVLRSQRELDELHEDEKNEIRMILRALTATVSVYQDDLIDYQNFLFQLDLIAAQAQYADEINAVLPQINKDKKLELKQAYHPLLYAKHRHEKKKIIPQSVTFNKKNRIMVISGPNAGGKSITLKTIGLLQLMLQSGLLVPVHEKSNFCFFKNIFTDIGDNQSIENQLSTYSYRLKQMHYFLYNSDAETLLLIDEFGTGSDPELGGALAEVFLEEFYEMGAYGVFTTHYTNIKILVEQLPEAENASMLFDEKTLEPMYLLESGQAGSSFTFEVAEKNKIPYRLINKAKKKIERNKVRLDKTILKLQQEKYHVQKTKNALEELKEKSHDKHSQLEETHDKIYAKLVDFQRLYESEQKNIQLGQKLTEMADVYLKNRSRKQLITKFLKLIEIENAKKNPKHFEEKKKEKRIKQKLRRELDKKADRLEETQQKIEEEKKKETQMRIASMKIGDRVRIKGSSSVGSIEAIDKKQVVINYGKFRTKINIEEIEKI